MTTISILSYDQQTHRFNPNIQLKVNSPAGHSFSAEDHVPSKEWMEDYRKWNNFEENSNGSKGHPVFDTADQLFEFNQTGYELTERLQAELPSAKVETYKPIYSNVEVGNSVAAWWHVRDNNYGFIVPIQHLPVSEDLKSRLQAWRSRKGLDWTDTKRLQRLNKEGHELEEHILWELNIRVNENPSEERRQKLSKQETAESMTGEIHHCQ